MNYILIGLVFIGFIPLVIILIRKKKNDRLKKTGIVTSAKVVRVHGFSTRSINLADIEYIVNETGETISKTIRVAGLPYAAGDELPIIYDPRNPHHMQLDMKKGFLPMLIFTLLIAAFIIFACFKLKQMMQPAGG